MSWLSSGLEKLGMSKETQRKVGGTVGTLEQALAPVLVATGVGAPIGAGLAAHGSILKNTSAGKSLGASLPGAALSAAGAAAGGMAGKAALGGLGAGGGGGSAGGGGGLQGLLQKALGFATSNPELVLGGIGAVSSAKQGAKANGQMEEMLRLATSDYESRAPLRAEILRRALALSPQNVDLSADFADAGNPYSRTAESRDALAKAVALGGAPKLGMTPPRSNLSLQPGY